MEKTFESFVIMHWKTGRMRITKNRPKYIKPTEIPVKVKLVVQISDGEEVTIERKIIVPEYKVMEMTADAV